MSLIARLHRQPFGLTRRMLMRAASSCHGEGEILVKGPRDHVISTGVLAGHCSGSCTITRGGTTVLAAVVKNERGVHNNSYLSVKYIERDRAAALIPSNYFRRSNGAPSTREIVIGRLIDRSLRPLVKDDHTDSIEVTVTVLSADGIHNPDVLAINAASTALQLSHAVTMGTAAAVRVGLVNGKLVVDPSIPEMATSPIDLVYTGTPGLTPHCEPNLSGRMLMIAGSALPGRQGYNGPGVTTDEFFAAICAADAGSFDIAQAQLELVAMSNDSPKTGIGLLRPPFSLVYEGDRRQVSDFLALEKAVFQRAAVVGEAKIYDLLANPSYTKHGNIAALNEVAGYVEGILTSQFPNLSRAFFQTTFERVVRGCVRRAALKDGVRADGRPLDGVRPISSAVGVLPALRGSAMFVRGETQVLASTVVADSSLTDPVDALAIKMCGAEPSNFALTYSYPAFCMNRLEVGEGRWSPKRREVGHANLAGSALRAVVPTDYRYAIQTGVDVLASHGSSSMASVCAGSMSLMHAGVPLLDAVAGMSCGLFSYDENEDFEPEQYKLITDITGLEDISGDMDLKLAGTRTCITAFQADVKKPVPLRILKEALVRATEGRSIALAAMSEQITVPNSARAITPSKVMFPKALHRKFIGPGGDNINALEKEFGVKIKISGEELTVQSDNEAALISALTAVKNYIAAHDGNSNGRRSRYGHTNAKLLKTKSFPLSTPAINALLNKKGKLLKSIAVKGVKMHICRETEMLVATGPGKSAAQAIDMAEAALTEIIDPGTIMEIKVPTSKYSQLIGRAGSTIQAISEISGTDLNLNKEAGLLEIRGKSKKETLTASRAINAVIAFPKSVDIQVSNEWYAQFTDSVPESQATSVELFGDVDGVKVGGMLDYVTDEEK